MKQLVHWNHSAVTISYFFFKLDDYLIKSCHGFSADKS